MCVLYDNGTYEFILRKTEEPAEGAGRSGAKIVRLSADSREEIVLFDYLWPEQLSIGIEAGNILLREDGVLCWELYITAHHKKGMALGEYTETEWFELKMPFGTEQEMVCQTVDIVRKTRFVIAERHLKHLPHQTYPAVDGRQGPYGHP